MSFRRLGAATVLAVFVSSALPACSATANVSDVWMSIDEDGARHRSVFFTDSKGITCVAEVGVGRKDVTFEMVVRQIRRASFGTDDFEAVNAVLASGEFHPDPTPNKPGTITLTVHPTTVDSEGRLKEDPEAPFTPGSYVCEVMLDGEKQKQVAFNIDYPPCPTVTIVPKARCAGFYTLGAVCPARGLTGDPTPTCSCTDTGWACQ